jgi:hypothetical protein
VLNLPITITQSGVYCLASTYLQDVGTGPAGAPIIEVAGQPAGNTFGDLSIVIDLNGFAISTGTAIYPNPASSVAIYVHGTANVEIRNGALQNVEKAIHIDRDGVVERSSIFGRPGTSDVGILVETNGRLIASDNKFVSEGAAISGAATSIAANGNLFMSCGSGLPTGITQAKSHNGSN